MPAWPKPTFKLRTLILLFALFSAVVTLANNFWVTYSVQREALVQDALEDNASYARRISVGVEQLLGADMSRLAYSAGRVATHPTDRAAWTDEVQRLLAQDDNFNSVLMASASGDVMVAEPARMHLEGKPLRDREPLKRRSAMISDAFKSIAGNLVIFLSSPIQSVDGEYLGLMGGTVRLDQNNALRDLIDQHVRHDGAFVYLVDRSGRILYHPDPQLVGTLADDVITGAALKGEGSLQDHGMLAGFASVPTAQWAVVSLQPLASIDTNLRTLAWKVVLGMVPLGALGIVVILCAGSYLSSPLARLARCAGQLDNVESYEQIRAVPVRFIEEWRIRRALLQSAALLREKILRLNRQAQSDALTGLPNRRAMVDAITEWQRSGTPFAVVSVDIDHFKRVNDTYGHATGDDTLKVLAALLRRSARPNDLPCRVGGEEFMLLLPEVSVANATEVAERLRRTLETTHIDIVGQITLSAGVADWHPGGDSISSVFEEVDRRLYQAKKSGRNRVVAASD